jgi:hypothetical protein
MVHLGTFLGASGTAFKAFHQPNPQDGGELVLYYGEHSENVLQGSLRKISQMGSDGQPDLATAFNLFRSRYGRLYRVTGEYGKPPKTVVTAVFITEAEAQACWQTQSAWVPYDNFRVEKI